MRTTKAVREWVATDFPTVLLFVSTAQGKRAVRERRGGVNRMERKNTGEARSGVEASREGASSGGSDESGGASIGGGCSKRAGGIAEALR